MVIPSFEIAVPFIRRFPGNIKDLVTLLVVFTSTAVATSFSNSVVWQERSKLNKKLEIRDHDTRHSLIPYRF